MKVPFVDLKAQYLSLKEEIDTTVQEVILNSAFIGGQHVRTFEENFATYLGVKHCVGVGNGTDALFVALKSLGVGTGDEVVTVANSFIATSEAITMTGAKVVFVDCEPTTYNMDTNKLEAVITPKTKAILPVHLYGQPANIEAILNIASKRQIYVVEDAAQAHGATYKGQKVGEAGHLACFSFYPGKNLGAYGDGGAIVTNDESLARKARMFANHGRVEKYSHEFEGINSRLDGLQAAILNVKLRQLDKWNERRRQIAAHYNKELSDLVTTPFCSAQAGHVYHLYVIQVPQRGIIQGLLKERGVQTGIHYPIPLPALPAYQYLGHKPEDFPISFFLKDKILSLPIHGNMPDYQVEYVCEQLREVLPNVSNN
ncbi:MAG: DegT/DnrJ/EryC1/StrS family aminotransferase [Desulfomonilaceae bacterium]